MSFDLEARNQELHARSQMMVYGRPTNKLDFLGTISIYHYEYFNVFRRYNNVHEIVVEDYNGDLHFIKNETLRQTLEGILCLSEEQTQNLYIQTAFSFKHQAEIVITQDMVDLTWSDIQHMWGGLVLNMGGILEDYHRAVKAYQSPAPADAVSVPGAPQKSGHICYQFNGVKRQRLSDRFAEMEETRMKDEDGYEESEDEDQQDEDQQDEEQQDEEQQDEEEEDEAESDEEQEEDDYMELRSGAVYYKK